MKTQWQILVVDDEEVMCESLAAWLREDGYTVETASSGREAIEQARRRDYAIYFVDLKMPGGIDGIETMMEIRRIHPDASIIIITAYATVDTAIAAMKEGAQEYIVKPCSPEEISLLVTRIIKVKNLQRENSILRKKLSRQYRFGDIISKNPRMKDLVDLACEISNVRSTVLIQGESGTGKELIARAIHFSGERAPQPFVAVSCAALAETLLETELFGHEKGAFTGASQQKKGKFEIADGGTLLLDEIGDISPKLQIDLLRVLQERAFYRVGGSEEIRVDVRVIAATKVDLREAVQAGRFRDDLFYRLNVIEVHVPPLRERREDVPLLVDHFLERLAPELRKDITGITEDALKLLVDYNWPGNVRELENTVERAMITCRSHTLTEEDFGIPGPATQRRGLDAPGGHPAGDGETDDRGGTAAFRRQHQGIGRRPGYRPLDVIREDQALRNPAVRLGRAGLGCAPAAKCPLALAGHDDGTPKTGFPSESLRADGDDIASDQQRDRTGGPTRGTCRDTDSPTRIGPVHLRDSHVVGGSAGNRDAGIPCRNCGRGWGGYHYGWRGAIGDLPHYCRSTEPPSPRWRSCLRRRLP